METVLNSHAATVSPHLVEKNVVDVLEQNLKDASSDLPGMGLSFQKRSFFAHDVGRGAYYKLPGLQLALAAAIGRIEAALAEEEAAVEREAKIPPRKTDPLTGLLAREALNEDLPKLLSQGRPVPEPLAIVMVDIDKFKGINDGHGHLKGDAVLLAVATALRSGTRGKGEAYRYGGEEMTLILPNHTLDEATALAERLRKELEGLDVDGLRVTASFGVSVFPANGATAQEIINAADQALYDAKRRGRNLVRVFGEDVHPAQGASIPARKVAPPPGELSEEDGAEVRTQYLATHRSHCPRDGCLLSVRVGREIGVPIQKLWIDCPQCGLSTHV
jgi:diguanylate cyclase (GGDEF)-like protein